MADMTLEALDSPKPKRESKVTLERRQQLWGMVFIAPWVIGFLLFTALPIAVSFYWTFTDYKLTDEHAPNFIGLENWIKLFQDPLTLKSLGVTLTFAAIAVPIGLFLPLMMAALLNAKHLWGKRIWRTLFYLPYMVPAISGIFIWRTFLGGQTGWLNRILTAFGFTDLPDWLGNPDTMHFAFLLMGIWGVGNAMLTMLATMQGVPTELYEAADVDGAGAGTKFWNITLPLISPVLFYNLVLSVIGLMQYFTVPYVATLGTGGPNQSAYFINMHLYKTAFTFFDMGYGATLAWFIFIVALILTLVMFTTANRWVYYAAGD
jgi:ABC-type sugar transport system permease subunit